MAHIIGLKVETIDENRRNALLDALCELINEQFAGADSATITYTREVKTSRGKRKIVDTIEIEPGELVSFVDLDETIGLKTARPLDELWGAATVSRSA